MKRHTKQIRITVRLFLIGLLLAMAWRPANVLARKSVQRGYVGAQGLVRSPDKNPVWVEYDKKGKLVRIIHEAVDEYATAEVMSPAAYQVRFPDNHMQFAPNVKTVLIGRDTGAILDQSDSNIAYRSSFYTLKDEDVLTSLDSTGSGGLYGFTPDDTLWEPIKGARVEAPGGWRAVTDKTGCFALPYHMPVSCLNYSDLWNLLVTMRFKNFDPQDRDSSGFYYLSWPVVFYGGGDTAACPDQIGIGLSPATVTYGDLYGIKNLVMQQAKGWINFANIPVNVAILTGKAIFKNEARKGYGIEIQGPVGYKENEDTQYFASPSSSGGDMVDRGLLQRISKADLENTDIYLFRESNDQLVAAQEGLGPNMTNWYYGGGAFPDSARINYKLMICAPAAFKYQNRRAEYEKWQSAVHVDAQLRGMETDHLRAGEYVRVVALNRATGYIGTARVQVGLTDTGAETLLNFSPDEIIMRPPNLKITAERKYIVDMGLTNGTDYSYLIGFEGSGLTSDEYIALTTEWTDWNGHPLPSTLPGYTGRLAKVVSPGHLGQAQVADFDISPGKHIQLVKLPREELDTAHYYVHVSGAHISDNPDFSSACDEDGQCGTNEDTNTDDLLYYRPKRYVPIRVPFFDEAATKTARKDDSNADAVYNWLYRPEMQFSLFDLKVTELWGTDQQGQVKENRPCIEDPSYRFHTPSLTYLLFDPKLPMLNTFGEERELCFGLGTEAIPAIYDNEQFLSFKNPGSIMTLSAADMLGIRLTQASDPENILWRYDFPVIQSITLKIQRPSIPIGGTDTAIAHTNPENRPVTWSVTYPFPKKNSDPNQEPEPIKKKVFVQVDPNTGVITVDKQSPSGWFVLRATDKEYADVYREEIIFVGCTTCITGECKKNGKASPNLGCVDTRFSIGTDTRGESAGSLMLWSNEITDALHTPAKLLFTTVSWDHMRQDGGIEQVNAPDGSLHQILAPESFVTIDNITDSGYDLCFYKRSGAGDIDPVTGYYKVVPGAVPDATWRISGTADTLVISDILHNNKTYIYARPAAGEMTLTTNNSKVEKRSVTQNGDTYIVTESVEDTTGNVATKTAKTFYAFAWGNAIIREVEDPDNAALTTSYTYYEDPAVAGSYSRIKSRINPDGSWARFEYDAEGRMIKEIRSWLDAPPTAPESVARVITYDYTIVDPSDADLAEDHSQARTVTESISGIVVSKTYYAYLKDGFDNKIEIEKQCVDPFAAYGAPDNLRTTRVYFKYDPDSVTSGKIRSIQYPDGRLDTYYYETGAYSPGLPGIFTRDTGTDVRECVLHGTVEHPAGIPYKTTRDISVRDMFGRPRMNETSVFDGGDYARISWTVYILDADGHVIRTNRSDGAFTEAAWGCCYRESVTDATGITTFYTYDDLDRVSTQTRPGPAGDIISSFTYDAAGRRLAGAVSAGDLSQSTTSTYDSAGRMTRSVSADGLVTTYTYADNGRTTTVTRPGGATETTEHYLDGRVRRVYGTATAERYYEYGVNPDGSRWTKVYTGGQGAAAWEKTTTDPAGRTILAERPGFNGTIMTSRNFYDRKGRLVKTSATGHADTLYAYNDNGEQYRTALDINANNLIDLAGPDRVNGTDTHYTTIGGDWWRETVRKVYAGEGSDTPTVAGAQRTRLTGLGTDSVAAESVTIDIAGNITVADTYIDPSAHTETRTIDYPDSDIDAQSVSANGFLVSSTSKTGITVSYAYDALGRRIGVTDPRTGSSVTHYDAAGRVDYVEDAAGNRTTFTYDETTGRKIADTNALGRTTRYAYNIRGQVLEIWGDAAYPVRYTYDAFGRMTQMETFRADDAWNADTWPDNVTGDTTAWAYDTATGLLVSKTDAASNAVAYTYDAAGRLSVRTWARTDVDGNPLQTAYSYDSATGELTGIDYSDETPDIAFTYDRMGRKIRVTDAAGVHAFAYNDDLRLKAETMTGIYNRTLTRDYADTGVAGRAAGFTMGSDYSVTYGYDGHGRFNALGWTAANTTGSASYGYIADSDLVGSLSTASGMIASYTYEPHRNLKTRIDNAYNTALISQYDYEYDALGRRTSVKNSGTAFAQAAFNLFDYNNRNELTGSNRYQGTDVSDLSVPVDPETRLYAYDPIGNRTQITEAAATGTYTANNLNQYTQQTVPGDGTRIFSHDADGNLTSFVDSAGSHVYTWNAENRLIAVAPQTPVDGDRKLAFTYDYLGRRVKKAVYDYAAGAWTLEKEKLFVYDGWNLVEEIRREGGTETSRYFVWGLDVSQSMQGAGGIGGLVAEVDAAGGSGGSGGSSLTYYFCYDGNGNVGQVVKADDGSIAAAYEYDPYGKVLKSGGVYAGENPFRFSTKYTDDETGLVYYGYRYYSSELGRWLSRDPIGEYGGLNLFLFLQNEPLTQIDFQGLIWVTKSIDYHAKSNWFKFTIQYISELIDANQLVMPSSDSFIGGERTVIQIWEHDPDNPCKDLQYAYGSLRIFDQKYIKFMRGPNDLTDNFPDLYYYQWDPYVADRTYEAVPWAHIIDKTEYIWKNDK